MGSIGESIHRLYKWSSFSLENFTVLYTLSKMINFERALCYNLSIFDFPGEKLKNFTIAL